MSKSNRGMSFKYILPVFIVAFMISCSDSSITGNLDQNSESAQEILYKGKPESNNFDGNAGDGELSGTENNYGIYEYELWAGKTTLAGTVSITSDDDNILLYIDSNDNSDISEVHVYVWTDESHIPNKRPAPGKAPYKAENLDTDSYSMSIPMTQEDGATFYISVHTAMTSGETAYAGGSNTPEGFPKGNAAWWGYVSYTVSYTPPVCEEVNLINGSFEQADGFDIIGWEDNYGRVGGYPIDHGTFWSTDGSYGIDLIGTGPSDPGFVEQSFATQAGFEYVVTFDAEMIGTQPELVVTIDGNAQNFKTGSHSINFTATSATTTLRFEANAYYNYLYNNVLLDNVTVSCAN